MKIITSHDGRERAYIRETRGEIQTANHDFGLRDSKGRKVGCRVVSYVKTYVDDENGRYLVPVEKVGESYFVVIVESTRNGNPFGASQRGKEFTEAADAHAHAVKAVQRSRKRAEKVHGAPA